MFGMGYVPLRATAAEEGLIGTDPAEIDATALGALATADLDPPTDIHASGEYRKAVAPHVIARAIAEPSRRRSVADVTITVNGTTHHVAVEPRKTLADVLREDLGLTGTHLGCEHGVCGACTVMIDGEAVRSCLQFAVQADGTAITTIEGLAIGGELTPVQQAMADHHGLQCGFCTPGS